MGELPKAIAFSGKYSSEFFNRKGELRHINKLRYWPLDAVLHDKYMFPKSDAEAVASFLTPMLHLHPDQRAKASELILHNWTDGYVVQGEVDVILRAEEEAAPKKVLEGHTGGLIRQSDEDAMKPVGDVEATNETGDADEMLELPQQQYQTPRLSAAPAPSSSGMGTSGLSRSVPPLEISGTPQRHAHSLSGSEANAEDKPR